MGMYCCCDAKLSDSEECTCDWTGWISVYDWPEERKNKHAPLGLPTKDGTYLVRIQVQCGDRYETKKKFSVVPKLVKGTYYAYDQIIKIHWEDEDWEEGRPYAWKDEKTDQDSVMTDSKYDPEYDRKLRIAKEAYRQIKAAINSFEEQDTCICAHWDECISVDDELFHGHQLREKDQGDFVSSKTRPVRCLFESQHNLIWREPVESRKKELAHFMANEFRLDFSRILPEKRWKTVWLGGRRRRVIL